jgi:hypothetical protein
MGHVRPLVSSRVRRRPLASQVPPLRRLIDNGRNLIPRQRAPPKAILAKLDPPKP